jgi:hypothetical protein
MNSLDKETNFCRRRIRSYFFILAKHGQDFPERYIKDLTDRPIAPKAEEKGMTFGIDSLEDGLNELTSTLESLGKAKKERMKNGLDDIETSIRLVEKRFEELKSKGNASPISLRRIERGILRLNDLISKLKAQNLK